MARVINLNSNSFADMFFGINFDNLDERVNAVEAKKSRIIDCIDDLSWAGRDTSKYDEMLSDLREIEAAIESWVMAQ